jgi:hypothetical protein
MSSLRRAGWEMIYAVEHSIELPADLLLFHTTRLTSDSWFGRCFCARALAAIDKINYHRFCWHLSPSGSGSDSDSDSDSDSIGYLENDEWVDKWREYVRWHNSMIGKL